MYSFFFFLHVKLSSRISLSKVLLFLIKTDLAFFAGTGEGDRLLDLGDGDLFAARLGEGVLRLLLGDDLRRGDGDFLDLRGEGDLLLLLGLGDLLLGLLELVGGGTLRGLLLRLGERDRLLLDCDLDASDDLCGERLRDLLLSLSLLLLSGLLDFLPEDRDLGEGDLLLDGDDLFLSD